MPSYVIYEGHHVIENDSFHTGVTRFSTELFHNLRRRCIVDLLRPRFSNRLYLFIWINTVFLYYAYKRNAGIMIFPVMNAPVFSTFIPSIVVIHDLNFLLYPRYYSFPFVLFYKLFMHRILCSATRVAVTTFHVKHQVATLYPDVANKIDVISAGVGSPFITNPSISETSFWSRKEQILLVASLDAHKNLERALASFQLNLNFLNHNLILIGNPRKLSSDSNIDSLIRSIGSHRLTIMSRITDYELSQLYLSSQLTIFPSLFEGFGSPSVESLSCGCPVLASSSSCMPEVLGNSVLYFDPFSTEDIALQTRLILSNTKLWQKMQNLGFEASQQYRYSTVSENLTSIIDKISRR